MLSSDVPLASTSLLATNLAYSCFWRYQTQFRKITYKYLKAAVKAKFGDKKSPFETFKFRVSNYGSAWNITVEKRKGVHQMGQKQRSCSQIKKCLVERVSL